MKASPYLIGDVPTFDPCDKCLIKEICSKICEAKVLFDRKNVVQDNTIRIKRPKRRKKKNEIHNNR